MDAVVALAAAAALAGSLLAGLYLAFAIAVVPALSRVDDAAFVGAWQAINRVILRPGFLVLFLGAPVLCVWVAVVGTGNESGWAPVALWAGGIGQVGGLLYTGVAHVPLNTGLEAASGRSAAEARAARAAFEVSWTRRHRVRTGITVLAAALTVVGVLAP